MTDLSLRLPDSRVRAVLNLGPKRAAAMKLPARFAEPELFADWDDEGQSSALYIEFEHGQLHLETTGSGIDHHFHGPRGEDIRSSPWPPRETAQLVAWGELLTADFHALMPGLLDDIQQAAAWHDAGFDLYVCEVEEPAQLDLIEAQVEGEFLTLPWLGAGSVANDHIEGDNHPIALLWGPGESEPDRPIAEAWIDPETEAPVTRALPGVDWNEIGLPADEVLVWLEGIYLNHHVIPDASGTLLMAVLDRLGGLDSD
ncbi:MAG: hypothetical protein JWR53_951 [Glaciihabitans sp.]|jgi:hypothetical protein|nr:hypothetical protein [Glaciihabitans sp.]MDQ1555707.1 hypothetical protein [Actinomycetota bacterium]